jgi:hypothetical protein
MRRTTVVLAFILVLAAFGSMAARADRDIVYGARYYLKPGLHGRSHFHLYRVNPDGSGRTQITRGKGDDIYLVPGDHNKIIYGAHAGETTGGPAQVFYLVDLKTGQFSSLVEGTNLAWGPDGKRFATGSRRGLVDRGISDEIWISSLSIASLKGAKKQIVSGLVWVDGFDWR